MKYDLLYVLGGNYTEAELASVKEKINGLIAGAQATLTRHDHLGKLKLAYPIKGNRFGHYFTVGMEADADAISRLKSVLRLTPEVIRSMLVRPEKGQLARQAILSFEEAVAHSRATREAVAQARMAPATASSVPPAPPAAAAAATPRPAISEEDIEKKLEKLLSEEEVIT